MCDSGDLKVRLSKFSFSRLDFREIGIDHHTALFAVAEAVFVHVLAEFARQVEQTERLSSPRIGGVHAGMLTSFGGCLLEGVPEKSGVEVLKQILCGSSRRRVGRAGGVLALILYAVRGRHSYMYTRALYPFPIALRS